MSNKNLTEENVGILTEVAKNLAIGFATKP
jgi:hypothetical protein